MKRIFIIISLFLMSITIVSCNKKETEEKTTEITEVETATIEENTEGDVIISGGGKDDSTIATETDVIEMETQELPETMEPLNNNDKFNPRFTSLNNMQYNHFNREAIMDAVLDYMYKEGISDDVCTVINVDQNNSGNQNIAYKLTLSFENNEDREVTLFGYSNYDYEIQEYINPQEDEITPDD